MRRMSWTATSIAVLGTIFGVALLAGEGRQQESTVVEPVSVMSEAGTTATVTSVMSVGTAGSALASAAFGLDALQPETYNGEIVLDIIDASPLAGTEKRRLAAGLEAAEAGRADLQRVLSDVRYALAVE